MKIHFGQIYIEAGASFPFTHKYQLAISENVSKLVVPSDSFVSLYGQDYELMIRVSAKKGLKENEIKGPTVFKKEKDIEFTIFLPHDILIGKDNWAEETTIFLLKGLYSVLNSLGINSDILKNSQTEIVTALCCEPENIKLGI